MVKIIHGEEDAQISVKISDFLFGFDDKLDLLKNLSQEEFEVFFESIGGTVFTDQNLFGLFIESELEKSGTTTRQSLSSGALCINEEKITDVNYDFSHDFIDGKFLLLRKGKKNYRIVKR